MRAIFITIITLIIGCMISACGGTSSSQQTLEALNVVQGTQFANVIASATVERDRLQVTVEYMNRELTRVQQMQSSMLSTLDARGISVVLPGISISTPSPTATIIINNTNTDASSSGATPDPNPVLNPSPSPPLTGLTNIIMSTGVQQDDCPINNTTQFAPETAEIYVTAVANNLPVGTNIRSRWIHNNEELAVYEYVPDFAINQACIWFFVDETDFEFTNGVYVVILEVNGFEQGEVTFTIVESQ